MSDDERPVHPAAAVFPMLTDDELADLADDIKTAGLLHPIVLDVNGAIVDGRNRYEACRRAGVEPRYETLPERTDPRSYILSQNVKRRHMKAGAIAVAVARMYEGDGDGEEVSGSGHFLPRGAATDAAKVYGINRQRFVEAAQVVRYAPDLADSVLSGGYALDKAYKDARERKDAASSLESQLGQLRGEAPDLADLVVEERISLREALDILDRRRVEDRKRRQAATASMVNALNFLAPAAGAVEDHAAAWMTKYDPSFVAEGQEVSPERIDNAVGFLDAVRVALMHSD